MAEHSRSNPPRRPQRAGQGYRGITDGAGNRSFQVFRGKYPQTPDEGAHVPVSINHGSSELVWIGKSRITSRLHRNSRFVTGAFELRHKKLVRVPKRIGE